MNLSDLKKLKQLIQEEVTNALAPHLKKVDPGEIDAILSVGDKAFGTYQGFENVVSQNPMANYKEEADWQKSVKMVLGDKIIGYYLLTDKESIKDLLNKVKKMGFKVQINNEHLLRYAEENKGVQGLSMGILPEFKGKGYAKLLFDYPKSIGYKFVWGIQTKGMSNLDLWMKRREVVVTFSHSGQEFYVTMERF